MIVYSQYYQHIFARLIKYLNFISTPKKKEISITCYEIIVIYIGLSL